MERARLSGLKIISHEIVKTFRPTKVSFKTEGFMVKELFNLMTERQLEVSLLMALVAQFNARCHLPSLKKTMVPVRLSEFYIKSSIFTYI